MAPYPNARRFGLGQFSRWAIALGLLLGSNEIVLAQQSHLSVALQSGPGCGGAIPGTVLQQDTETQLRKAGIAVSRVHTAALNTDFDCVPVKAESRAASLAVHQCLSLSQVVSMPTHSNGMTMATTWRQCESYTCSGRECQGYARTGQRGLVDAFLVEFRERAAKPTQTAPAPAQPAAVPLQAGMADAPKPGLRFTVVFYVAYILMCLAVLARWEWCR